MNTRGALDYAAKPALSRNDPFPTHGRETSFRAALAAMLADFPHLADFAREQADLAGCSAVDGWREDCARVARALRRSGASPRSLAQAGAVLQSFEVLSGLLREIAEWVGDARGVGILRGVRIQEFGSFSECARNSGILDTINQARRAIRTFEQKEGTP